MLLTVTSFPCILVTLYRANPRLLQVGGHTILSNHQYIHWITNTRCWWSSALWPGLHGRAGEQQRPAAREHQKLIFLRGSHIFVYRKKSSVTKWYTTKQAPKVRISKITKRSKKIELQQAICQAILALLSPHQLRGDNLRFFACDSVKM